ncbi:MAG: AGE family epimerase/isomerase [Bacteroidales bacterium]
MNEKLIFNNLRDDLAVELYSILTYWNEKTIDEVNGGFYGQIDGTNTLQPESPKGAVLNARILWTFSAAYRINRVERYHEMASRAKDYLMNHFIDKEFGGVYWMLDFKGNPIDTKKQIYAQSFAMYGLSEYYRATGDKTALNEAVNLFELIEKYSFDKDKNGYFEAYSRDWKLLEDLRLSDKDANEKKTMNTHLHVLEGYTNLYRVWPDENLKKQIIGLIDVFANQIINSNSWSFKLFFDENWQCKSEITSYGHDIEGSWLLLEAAEVVGMHAIVEKVKQIILKMAEEVLKNGLDADGGMINEKKDSHIDYDKHWWPQAEAIVGFVNAWQVSGDIKFLEKACKVWKFTKSSIIDKKGGEWFFRVNREGKPYPEEDKVGPWKCPYHNSRACFEIIERFGRKYQGDRLKKK